MLVAAAITVWSAVDYLVARRPRADRGLGARDAASSSPAAAAWSAARSSKRLRRARRRGGRARALGRGGGRARGGRRRRSRGDVLDEAALARGHGAAASSSTTWPASTRSARPTRRRSPRQRRAARSSRCAPPRAAGVPRVVLTSCAAAIGEARGHGRPRGQPASRQLHVGLRALQARGRGGGARRRAQRSGIEIVAVNPSSVQGPGRARGTGRILIAYLNGKLKVFVDTRISIVDIDDCVEGHLLAAERGQPRRALR